MKVALAILVCVVIQQACGFSFPSFETGNEALEKIKEAGREIIAKASKNVEGIQETVEEKLQPTERVKKILKDIEEKVSNQKEEWKERKKQMKEMYKEIKQKAGANKDELVKMWKENKGTWRQQAEEKWQSFKSMTAENLEQFKREIDSLEERLDATAPEKPWKKIKEIRSGVKSLIIAMKEAFQVKLRELKEKAEKLGPHTEEELPEEESEEASEATFTEGPFTDGPFTDEITTDPEELPTTPDVITDQLEPTEMLSTPTTEVLPTDYPDEEWNQEVVNDEQQTGEESEEEEGEDEVLSGGVEEEDGKEEEEDEEEGPVSEEESSRVNILSRLMSERRKQRMKHWMKRGKAMKSNLKNVLKSLFNKRRGDEN